MLWLVKLFDYIASKRLRVAMDTELAALFKQGDLQVSRACYLRLRHISAATMDRLRQSPPSVHAATGRHQARHVAQATHSDSHLRGLG
ncbi:MAG TPA: hypothetical protein VF429_09460 [Anaerolineae bacterium]